MTLVDTGSGSIFKAHSRSSKLGVVSLEERVPLSGSRETDVAFYNNNEVILDRITGASGVPQTTLEVDASIADYDLENLNEEKGTLVGNVFTAAEGQSGFAAILVKNKRGAWGQVQCNAAGVGSSTSYEFKGFASGVPASAGAALIISRLGADQNLYNGNSYAACAAQPGGIAWNPNCWAKDFDFSGVAIKHLNSNFNGGGALLTNRHYFVTNHYRVQNKVGMELKFLANDGTVHTRYVISQTTGSDVPAPDSPYTLGNVLFPDVNDVCCYTLNEPLPETVAVYRLTGPWYQEVVKTGESVPNDVCSFYLRHAAITRNQYGHVRYSFVGLDFTGFTITPPGDTYDINGYSFDLTGYDYNRLASGGASSYKVPNFSNLRTTPVVGDSGGAEFFVMPDGEMLPVFLYTSTQAGTYLYKSQCDAMILDADANAGIATGLTVTVAPDPTL